MEAGGGRYRTSQHFNSVLLNFYLATLKYLLSVTKLDKLKMWLFHGSSSYWVSVLWQPLGILRWLEHEPCSQQLSPVGKLNLAQLPTMECDRYICFLWERKKLRKMRAESGHWRIKWYLRVPEKYHLKKVELAPEPSSIESSKNGVKLTGLKESKERDLMGKTRKSS